MAEQTGAPAIDWSKAPEMPEYEGLDLDKYSTKYDPGAALDTSGYDALKGIAQRDISTDPNSVWGKLMLEKQGTEETDARSRAAAEASGALAQARSNLAQRGGLSSGASERLGAGGLRESMMRGQDISRQGIESRQGINISDEEQRQKAISEQQTAANAIKGLSLTEAGQRANVDTSNAQLAAGELGRKSAYDLASYADAGKKWYGEQMSEAQKQADLSKVNQGLIGHTDIAGNYIVAPNTPGATKDIFGNWILPKELANKQDNSGAIGTPRTASGAEQTGGSGK